MRNIQIIIIFSAILFFVACKKTDDVSTTSTTVSYTCTPYYGANNCIDVGYVPVTSTVCCPANIPYYSPSDGKCSSSCRDNNGSFYAGASTSSTSSTTSTNSTTSTSSTTATNSTTSTSSKLMFWTNSNAYGQINIYFNGTYAGTIASYYSSTPSCNANGCVTVTVVGTNNTWYGQQVGGSGYWSGSYTLTPGCNPLLLH